MYRLRDPPQSCRNFHATNVAGCRQSYEEPENLDIDPDFAPGPYQAGGAHVEAVSTAMRDAGYDVNAYELNSSMRWRRARNNGSPEAFRIGKDLTAMLDGIVNSALSKFPLHQQVTTLGDY